MADATDIFQRGMATRRAVLGDTHVNGAETAKTAFDSDFQAFITEGAWGSVWSRPGLTRRERSLITIALLAAAGHDEEVAMHVKATVNTGAPPRTSRRRCCMSRSMPGFRQPTGRSRSPSVNSKSARHRWP
jgi:alkylhydroperoxidase/carboxymuconolactone decarboxylase family protein YurZ